LKSGDPGWVKVDGTALKGSTILHRRVLTASDFLEKFGCGFVVRNNHALARFIDDAEELVNLDEIEHFPRILDLEAFLSSFTVLDESGMVIGEEIGIVKKTLRVFGVFLEEFLGYARTRLSDPTPQPTAYVAAS
jgi:hypothetical protein